MTIKLTIEPPHAVTISRLRRELERECTKGDDDCEDAGLRLRRYQMWDLEHICDRLSVLLNHYDQDLVQEVWMEQVSNNCAKKGTWSL